MKTIRGEYSKIYDYNNLSAAHRKSRLGKGGRLDVLLFETELNCNLYELQRELIDKTYKISGYRSFKIYEPKEREIMSLSYRDRIVQHSLCDNVLEPFLDKRLDIDNASCRRGKGTLYALDRLKMHMKKAYNLWGCGYYALKCDIRRYFYNIDHDILKKKLYKYISDKDLKWLLDVVIDSTEGKGVPIGNMTSQWFAVFYLDALDRFIRGELKIKLYTWYMDDFVLLHNDKDYLKQCLSKIREFLDKELRLELNEKTQILPIKNGVDYVGFHSYLTETGKVVRKLRRRSKATMKRKIKKFNQAYASGDMDYESVERSIMSWIGHAAHGDTYRLRNSVMQKLRLQRSVSRQSVEHY